MKKPTFFIALLALCGTFVLTSCGSDESEDIKPQKPTEPLTIEVTASQFDENIFYSDDLKFEVIPNTNSVTVYGREKYESWPKENDSPTEIHIPQTIVCGDKQFTVTAIGRAAFSNYYNLEHVTIPETIEAAEFRLPPFSNCLVLKEPIYNKTTFVKLPATYQGSYTIPEGIKTVSGAAFCQCNGLKSIDIPASVTSVEAILSCGITSITLPATVTYMSSSHPIHGCPNLTTVDFGDGITEFDGIGLFSECPKLTSVVFGKNVKKLEVCLGGYNVNLQEITIKSPTPPEAGEWILVGVNTLFAVLRVPAQSVEAYKAHPTWGRIQNIESL